MDLWNKEDKTKHLYGVAPSRNPTLINTKTDSAMKRPPIDEPIDITYNKKDGTVKLTSKTFECYQTDLPRD